MEALRHIVLLLDGDEPSEELLRRTIETAQLVVATDGAARIARMYEFPLDAIIGDMDSLDESTRKYYEHHQTTIIAKSDQYSNDFEKALDFLIDGGFTDSLVILGLHGKRTDHTLTNLSVLVRCRDYFNEVISIDNYHAHYLLTEKYPMFRIATTKGAYISLTPLPQAVGVRTEGLFYPITDEGMVFGNREGLSNIVSSDSSSVSITSGSLLISVAHKI